MNVFYLSQDLDEAARHHVDKWVPKLALEACQVLCTVNHLAGKSAVYRPTHPKHPITLFAAGSIGGYNLVGEYGLAVCREYTHRYGKTAKVEPILKDMLSSPPALSGGLGEIPQCMPDDVQVPGDPVQAYRNYVNKYKRHLFQWKKREIPNWIEQCTS